VPNEEKWLGCFQPLQIVFLPQFNPVLFQLFRELPDLFNGRLRQIVTLTVCPKVQKFGPDSVYPGSENVNVEIKNRLNGDEFAALNVEHGPDALCWRRGFTDSVNDSVCLNGRSEYRTIRKERVHGKESSGVFGLKNVGVPRSSQTVHNDPIYKLLRNGFCHKVIAMLDEDGLARPVVDGQFALDQPKRSLILRWPKGEALDVTVNAFMGALAAQVTMRMSDPRVHITDGLL